MNSSCTDTIREGVWPHGLKNKTKKHVRRFNNLGLLFVKTDCSGGRHGNPSRWYCYLAVLATSASPLALWASVWGPCVPLAWPSSCFSFFNAASFTGLSSGFLWETNSSDEALSLHDIAMCKGEGELTLTNTWLPHLLPDQVGDVRGCSCGVSVGGTHSVGQRSVNLSGQTVTHTLTQAEPSGRFHR